MTDPATPAAPVSDVWEQLRRLLLNANDMQERAIAQIPGSSEQALVALKFIITDIKATLDLTRAQQEAQIAEKDETIRQQKVMLEGIGFRDSLTQERATTRCSAPVVALNCESPARGEAEQATCGTSLNIPQITEDKLAEHLASMSRDFPHPDCRQCVDLRARLSDAEAIKTHWQPIETALKDEYPVLLFQPDGAWNKPSRKLERIALGYWHQPANPEYVGFWVACGCVDVVRPTHWMPLPAPPSDTTTTPDKESKA